MQTACSSNHLLEVFLRTPLAQAFQTLFWRTFLRINSSSTCNQGTKTSSVTVKLRVLRAPHRVWCKLKNSYPQLHKIIKPKYSWRVSRWELSFKILSISMPPIPLTLAFQIFKIARYPTRPLGQWDHSQLTPMSALSVNTTRTESPLFLTWSTQLQKFLSSKIGLTYRFSAYTTAMAAANALNIWKTTFITA